MKPKQEEKAAPETTPVEKVTPKNTPVADQSPAGDQQPADGQTITIIHNEVGKPPIIASSPATAGSVEYTNTPGVNNEPLPEAINMIVATLKLPAIESIPADSLLQTAASLTTENLHLSDSFMLEFYTPDGWDTDQWLKLARHPLTERLVFAAALLCRHIETLNK